MPWLDVFFQREPALDDAEERLGMPDELEATSLRHHTERCALRWILSYRSSKSNNAQLRQLKIVGFLILIVMILTSNPATKILEKFIG